MLRNLLLLSITLALSAQSKKEPELNIIEDAEAYNVYSAILDMEKPKGELLIADTTVPFNQCLDPHSDEPVDAAIQDYKKANQNQWHVGYHFVSTQPYKLLSRKEANTLLQRDRRTGDWSLSPYNGIHRFSAVGFSANKTIAFVEMDVVCGGLCGHGHPYILQKKDGKWERYDFRWTKRTQVPVICSWAY